MVQPTTRSPQVYRPGLASRMAEGFRYGGGIGQWSWLLHRLTGVGILVYLIVHIVDTFFVVVNPAWYDHALAMYAGEVGGGYFWPLRWAFRGAELGLIASVLFHAVNGVRIVLFDLWPGAALHQKALFRAVGGHLLRDHDPGGGVGGPAPGQAAGRPPRAAGIGARRPGGRRPGALSGPGTVT